MHAVGTILRSPGAFPAFAPVEAPYSRLVRVQVIQSVLADLAPGVLSGGSWTTPSPGGRRAPRGVGSVRLRAPARMTVVTFVSFGLYSLVHHVYTKHQ